MLLRLGSEPRLAILGLGVLLLTDCSRTAPADLSAEVDRICAMFCQRNVACHEPRLFETEDDCYEVCFEEFPSLHQQTECGAANRALYECVANTTTCEDYLDTNNVFAEDYTCKTEKQRALDACDE